MSRVLDRAWQALADEGGQHFDKAIARHRAAIEAVIRAEPRPSRVPAWLTRLRRTLGIVR